VPGAQSSNTPVNLGGRVQLENGSDLCAMVLASGQFVFTCSPNGPYQLQNLSREGDSTVTRQVYVDGTFPKVENIKGSVFETVVMKAASGCPDYNPAYNPVPVPESAGSRHSISGKILLQDTTTPICALVLANGSHQFSCGGSGEYALEFPLNNSGQFELQVYADGFAPTLQTLDDSSVGGDIRMAQASECD
jgi:hypothetical protein